MPNNILTTVENVLPGDFWTESYMHYVVYKVETVKNETTLYYVAVDTRDGSTRKSKLNTVRTTRFVANR